MEVGTWLSSLGLERYEQAFRENDIVAEVLPRLTTEDLIAIGVTSVGHRRMLLDAIAVLASTSKPVEAAFTFGTLSFLPYVGGNFGYLYGSGINDDFFAGPEIGLALGPINAKVAYDIPFNEGLQEGVVSATIGLGIRF